MAQFQLSTEPAEANPYGGYSVTFHLDGRAPIFPPRLIETNKTDEALAARDAYVAEVAATGARAVVCLRLKQGRAPNGFKAAVAKSFYVPVNL